MTSHINLAGDIDNELDDAALWAVIDSAAAASLVASSAFKGRKPPSLKHASPVPLPKPSPHARFPSPKVQYNHSDGEVLQGPSDHRPQKLAKLGSPCVSDLRSERSPTPTPLVMVKHVQRTPRTPVVYSSPETRKYSVTDVSSSTSLTGSDCNPITVPLRLEEVENGSTMMRHSLSGQFPTVSLFKEYQNAAMEILEKSDCTVISGNPYIKKSGWRKIAFYFNISFEIKDKTIEFDENRDVQRAEFIVRAYMPGGRFADGWGSCERREKRFMKPNHDIPSTAETRAKNKACQDLLGIGEYRSGAKHNCSR